MWTRFPITWKKPRLWWRKRSSKAYPTIGLIGNAADIYTELELRGVIPDVVTGQTPAHDLLSYVRPAGFRWRKLPSCVRLTHSATPA